MFVLFLALDHAPIAFETTANQLIAQAMDAEAERRGNAVELRDFESAWAALTHELIAAYHFEDVDQGREQVMYDDGLSLDDRTLILACLDRLRPH
jgi:acyl-homoserine lactone acylase PvdQ